MSTVLIVDQSEAICRVCSLILSEFGFVAEATASALDAMVRCQTAMPAVVIIDSGLTGALELVQNLRLLPNSHGLKIFYSVSKAELRTLMAAKNAGADDVVLKPFDRKALGEVFSRIDMGRRLTA
jgi:two-component system chemotaxis response regulator CheY